MTDTHDARSQDAGTVSQPAGYDLLVKNVRLARPGQDGTPLSDIGIKDGRFAKVASDIEASQALKIVDGDGMLAFPGLVDPHMHVGIYSPLEEDAVTESKAAAMGGPGVQRPRLLRGRAQGLAGEP